MGLHRMTKFVVYVVVFVAFIGMRQIEAAAQEQPNPATVGAGKTISIEYTLKLEDNSVVDTNVGSSPLTYEHGSRQMIPGLEKALEGMRVGEHKKVTVQPADGYGEVSKEAFIEVEKDQLPPDALKVGVMVQGQDPSGRVLRARVAEIKDNAVLLDFNHPLAGKTLYFEIKILNIN